MFVIALHPLALPKTKLTLSWLKHSSSLEATKFESTEMRKMAEVMDELISHSMKRGQLCYGRIDLPQIRATLIIAVALR
jgi:hypothetical protein